LGYVPDYFGAYEDMVVQEYLEFFAAAYNINGSQRTKVVNDVLELTDLAYKRDALVDSLSRGMKQRLSIARVLVHDPKVLLLDEPAGNLDPRARIEMRELLKELRRMGKTILISSHILPELADLCNKIGIIEQGELIYSGPVSDIIRRAKAGTVLQVSVATGQEQAAALLSQDPNIAEVVANNGYLQVSLKDGVDDFSFVPQRLMAAGYRLTLLKEEEVNLETAFMRLTKGMVQ
jgi:ABC-2 type transport system ATP-binding protein